MPWKQLRSSSMLANHIPVLGTMQRIPKEMGYVAHLCVQSCAYLIWLHFPHWTREGGLENSCHLRGMAGSIAMALLTPLPCMAKKVIPLGPAYLSPYLLPLSPCYWSPHLKVFECGVLSPDLTMASFKLFWFLLKCHHSCRAFSDNPIWSNNCRQSPKTSSCFIFFTANTIIWNDLIHSFVQWLLVLPIKSIETLSFFFTL